MTDNVTQHPKQAKNAVETAKTRMLDEFVKEADKKIQEQVKKAEQAARAYENECDALQAIIADAESDKAKMQRRLEGIA